MPPVVDVRNPLANTGAGGCQQRHGHYRRRYRRAPGESLPDILKEVPGLNLVQTGGPGGVATVFMRGTNSNHTKVLVDGIDVSDPSNAAATFDFAQFLTQDIKRWRCCGVRKAVCYGSDAIGGVINIVTKSGSGPAQLSASPPRVAPFEHQPDGSTSRFG